MPDLRCFRARYGNRRKSIRRWTAKDRFCEPKNRAQTQYRISRWDLPYISYSGSFCIRCIRYTNRSPLSAFRNRKKKGKPRGNRNTDWRPLRRRKLLFLRRNHCRLPALLRIKRADLRQRRYISLKFPSRWFLPASALLYPNCTASVKARFASIPQRNGARRRENRS